MNRICTLARSVVAVLVVCLGSCAEPSPPLNVLLITVDTLRADHLGFHGYGRATSPFLDEFSKRSLTFLDAYAQVPKTTPSVASLLTSQYPRRNAVRSNHHSLPETALTLPEVLGGAGYATVAFTTNANLIEEKGFAQGFEEFQYLERTLIAESVTSSAIERLGQGFDGPFFMWLHYIDPHGPYKPPPPYDELFVEDEHYDSSQIVELDYEPLQGRNENYVLGAVPRYIQRPFRDHPRRAEAAYYIAQYDAEIRYLDDQLARLVSHLEESGLTKDTVIVFTSDHGEGMGEHDYFYEHGWFVYENQVHVPLLIFVPSQANGSTITTPVRLLDVGRTILDLVGIPAPETFEGVSLTPLADRETWRPAPLYAETPTEEYPHQYRSLRMRSWKYIVDLEGSEELYNLDQDPTETNNLAADRSELVTQMRQRINLGPWMVDSDDEPIETPLPELDAELLEDLRSLGYIN